TSIDNAAASIAQDSTGSITVYKMPAVPGLAVGDTANVTAAVTRYGATLELAVDSAADVVKTGTTVPQGATISVVATSDVHGNVLNFDYGTNAAPSKAQGLAKVSTYVKGLRAANPNVMLIDNGDTIQGTPLVYYYNMIDKTTLYPMAAVMGAMKYDSWTLGNHEFNYGLENLNRIMTNAKAQGISILSANTYQSDDTNFVEPYTMKSFNINGKTVTVAVIGLTTKTVPSWEDPAHYAGLHFNDLVDEAKKWVPIVRANGADVVIIAAHTGLEGAADVIPENQAKALATQVSGVDVIVAGHRHGTINDLNYKNPEGKVVPIIEPGKWANNISQIDIAVDADGIVTGITTKNVAMTNTIAEDPEIVSLIAPYQTKTLEYTATVLGQSTGEYKGDKQLTQPTEIMELINKVQAGAAGTQLSIAAPLSLKAYIPEGDITIKDIMGVYVYENFLYGVEMTGKQIKDWMEYSVRYYKQVSDAADPIVKDPALNIADYNLDQLYGLTYDIDLTVPGAAVDASGRVVSGDRIKNLKYNGKLIKDTDVFTVAINNYRFNGGGGFMAAAGISNTDPSIVTYDSAKALGDDGQVRSLMMRYVQDNKTITPSSTNNWKISTSPVVQEVAVTGIILNSATLDIRLGNSQTLKATVLPQNATNKEVVWKSSNENVATVVNGVVTGLGKGTATITAATADGNYSAEAIVNVSASAAGIGLNKSGLKLKVGKSQKLVAHFVPGNQYSKGDFVWESSNTDVATVKDGIVTAVSEGAATITVKTSDGKYL
ncbi:MAG: 5'-nucleotidase C-terminal domain-containing protein, partial [Bacillota bacterium]